MKKVLLTSLALAFASTLFLAGNAAAMTISVLGSPDGPTDLDFGDSVSWAFDLSSVGFNVPGDGTVLGGGLLLDTADDEQDPGEDIKITIGGDTWTWEVDTRTKFFAPLGQIALDDLNLDGLIAATTVSTRGDFGINGISLELDVSPTPEPATMLLFGTGLAGLAGLRRRKMKKA